MMSGKSKGQRSQTSGIGLHHPANFYANAQQQASSTIPPLKAARVFFLQISPTSSQTTNQCTIESIIYLQRHTLQSQSHRTFIQTTACQNNTRRLRGHVISQRRLVWISQPVSAASRCSLRARWGWGRVAVAMVALQFIQGGPK